MEMARERQAEEVPDDNTYLVCPLSDDVVEAVRAGAYKFREQNFPQEYKKARQSTNDVSSELKERRRLREAGEFVPDSGVSCVDDFKEFREFAEAYNDPLLLTQFVRRECYWQLNKEQMQRAVARYYGWEKWSENPWGSYPKFCKWISSAHDNEMAVWAVNETSMGRGYLVRSILEGIGQLDYSKMTEKDLLTQIGYGAAAFLHVKRYTGWEDFLKNYPTEPLPVTLVNERVSKVYPFDRKFPYSEIRFPRPKKTGERLYTIKRVHLEPFEEAEDVFTLFIREYGPLAGYRFLVSGIYLWYIALDEARERAKEHPETEGFLDYHAATDTQMAELCQKLAPKDYRLPDENQAWQKLEQALKKRLEAKATDYDDVYPLRSEIKDDILKESYVAAQEGLLEGINYWKSKAYEAAVAGLKGQLGNSLLSIVKHNLIDAARQNEPPGKKMAKLLRRETEVEPESEQEKQAANYISGEDKQAALKHLAYELGLQRGTEEDVAEDKSTALERLALIYDKLKPRELLILEDVQQGLEQGVRFGSKEGSNFRQYWGKDYGKKIRAWDRLKSKLNRK